MRIRNLTLVFCCVTVLYSCSNLMFPGSMRKHAVAVRTVQPITSAAGVQSVKETTTQPLSFNEKVLVGDCVLKDSSALLTFSVIVGSFAQPASAKPLIDKLRKKSMIPFFVQNNKGLYRLVAGTFKDRDDADFLMLKLDVSDIEAWVLTH